MIRISWCMQGDTEKVYHGSWYPDADEALLQSWIEALSDLYPSICHWIETGSGDS